MLCLFVRFAFCLTAQRGRQKDDGEKGEQVGLGSGGQDQVGECADVPNPQRYHALV